MLTETQDAAKKDPIDLSTLVVPEDAIVMDVIHPRTKEKIAEIDLVSQESSLPSTIATRQTNRRLRVNPWALKKPVTKEEMEDEALDVLIACTKGWRGIDWDGQPLPCTPENVRMLYTRLPWLRREVGQFTGELSNFLPE